MNEKIVLKLPDPVLFVLDRLRERGFRAYVVGGCVRDAVMGREPGDYDVTTAARPDDMEAVFSDCRVVETGLKHGTLTVVCGGMNVEITTYRIDGVYLDGRHPAEVTFTDRLADDLCRRDLTVNAMAYAPDTGLVDLFDGRGDIERKIIRCVGEPAQRFSEDGLRILRALRFASVLGFGIDGACGAAILEMKGLLDRISRERISSELTKLLMGDGAARILTEYAPVVAHTAPPLTEDAVQRAGERFAAIGKDGWDTPVSVRRAVLLDSLDDARAAAVADSMKPSRDEKRAVMSLLTHRDVRVAKGDAYAVKKLMRDVNDGFPAELGRFLRLTERIGGEEEKDLRELAADIVRRGECRRIGGLAVDGTALAAIGAEGAEIGGILAALLEGVMRGTIENEREALLAAAREMRVRHDG